MSICERRKVNLDGQCIHYIPEGTEHPYVTGFCSLQSEFHCIDELVKFVPRLSHSSVIDWLKCRKLYWWKQLKGIQRKSSTMGNPLKMGSLWDACQDLHYGSGDKQKIYDVIDAYEMDPVSIAKVRAMNKAFNELGLRMDGECTVQSRFEFVNTCDKIYTWNQCLDWHFVISGVIDREYEGFFVENKFTGNPDTYLDPFYLLPQVGTYFIARPNADFCIMELARTPGLVKSDKEDEDMYEKRVFDDIMKRPAFYFVGYNKERHSYGKKFFRTEFNLAELIERYNQISYEIQDAAARDAFYCNSTACKFPFECDMYDVCRNGVLSESLYESKKKPGMETTGVTEQQELDV